MEVQSKPIAATKPPPFLASSLPVSAIFVVLLYCKRVFAENKKNIYINIHTSSRDVNGGCLKILQETLMFHTEMVLQFRLLLSILLWNIIIGENSRQYNYFHPFPLFYNETHGELLTSTFRASFLRLCDHTYSNIMTFIFEQQFSG